MSELNRHGSPDDEWGTIKEACRIVGGNKPINTATYYRAAHRGEVPAPVRRIGGVSRVNLTELRAKMAARAAKAAEPKRPRPGL